MNNKWLRVFEAQLSSKILGADSIVPLLFKANCKGSKCRDQEKKKKRPGNRQSLWLYTKERELILPHISQTLYTWTSIIPWFIPQNNPETSQSHTSSFPSASELNISLGYTFLGLGFAFPLIRFIVYLLHHMGYVFLSFLSKLFKSINQSMYIN